MHRFQHEESGSQKNQVNMTPVKETNKATTDPREVKIYESSKNSE